MQAEVIAKKGMTKGMKLVVAALCVVTAVSIYLNINAYKTIETMSKQATGDLQQIRLVQKEVVATQAQRDGETKKVQALTRANAELEAEIKLIIAQPTYGAAMQIVLDTKAICGPISFAEASRLCLRSGIDGFINEMRAEMRKPERAAEMINDMPAHLRTYCNLLAEAKQKEPGRTMPKECDKYKAA